MRHVILSALAAASFSGLIAMPAMARPLQHFSRDGESYSYVVDREANGVVLLRGTVDGSGEDFTLRVHGTYVDGTIGMSSVAFRVSPEAASRFSGEVAALPTPVTLAAN